MAHKPAPKKTSDEDRPADARRAAGMASKLVDRFALWSGVAGLIPSRSLISPVGGLQIQMVRRLSQIYRRAVFGKPRQGVIASLVGSLIPATSGIGAASMLKFVPVIGTVTAALSCRCCRRAPPSPSAKRLSNISRSGGTLLDLIRRTIVSSFRAQKEMWDLAIQERQQPSSFRYRRGGGGELTRTGPLCRRSSGDSTAEHNVRSGAQTEPYARSHIYIVFCLLTGLCGIDRRMGFFGTFLLAIVTTPFVVLPLLLITGPSRRAEQRRHP